MKENLQDKQELKATLDAFDKQFEQAISAHVGHSFLQKVESMKGQRTIQDSLVASNSQATAHAKKVKMRLKEIAEQNEKEENEYKKEEESARGHFKMQLHSSERQRDFSSNRSPSYWLPYEPRRKFFMDFHSGTPSNLGDQL